MNISFPLAVIVSTLAVLAFQRSRYLRVLKHQGSVLGLIRKPFESVAAFRNRIYQKMRTETCAPVEIRYVYGVLRLDEGNPGEIVVVTNWWADRDLIRVEAEKRVPDCCFLIVRRETFVEWFRSSFSLGAVV